MKCKVCTFLVLSNLALKLLLLLSDFILSFFFCGGKLLSDSDAGLLSLVVLNFKDP